MLPIRDNPGMSNAEKVLQGIPDDEMANSKSNKNPSSERGRSNTGSNSGFLRTQIGLTKSRLNRYLDEVQNRSYDFSNVDPDIKSAKINESIRVVESDLIKIRNEQSRIEGYIKDWLYSIDKLVDQAARKDESSRFTSITESSDGVYELLNSSYVVVDELEARRNELNSLISSVPNPVSISGWPPQMNLPLNFNQMSINPPPPTFTPQNRFFNLPQLELGKFDGNISGYQSWKEKMKIAILDRNDLPDIVKLQYTIDRLEGKAAAWIGGVPNISSSLPIIWDILDKNCDSESYKQSLHRSLHKLWRPSETSASSRKFFDELESILRQLENMKESVDHPIILETILEKLPKWILDEVIPWHVKDPSTRTVSKLREQLENLIRIREETERYKILIRPNVNHQSQSQHNLRSNQFRKTESEQKTASDTIQTSAFAVTQKNPRQNFHPKSGLPPQKPINERRFEPETNPDLNTEERKEGETCFYCKKTWT